MEAGEGEPLPESAVSGLWSKPAVAAVVAGGGESGGCVDGGGEGAKSCRGGWGCAGCGWVGCGGSGEECPPTSSRSHRRPQRRPLPRPVPTSPISHIPFLTLSFRLFLFIPLPSLHSAFSHFAVSFLLRPCPFVLIPLRYHYHLWFPHSPHGIRNKAPNTTTTKQIFS